MNSLPSIASSGMAAAQMRLQSAASNIANMSTENYRRQEVSQTAQAGGGVSTSVSRASVEGAALETDVLAQLEAKNSFLANLAVFKTSNHMQGALLDEKA
jgi:flagellar hook-associated protein FlgK